MNKTTWTDKAVASALTNYIPVQVDTDQYPDIAAKFHVDPLPNLVITDENGMVLKSTMGFHSAAAVQDWLSGKSPE